MSIELKGAKTRLILPLAREKVATTIDLSAVSNTKKKIKLNALPEIFFFASDLLTITISLAGGYFIRFAELNATNKLSIDTYSISYKFFLIFFGLLWLAALIVFGNYQQIRPLDYFTRIKQTLKITTSFFFTVGFISFVFKISLSRLLIVSIFCLAIVNFLILRTFTNKLIQKFLVQKIEIRSNLIVIGSNSEENIKYIEWIRNNKKYGLKVQVNVLLEKFDSAAQARIRAAITDYPDVKVLLLPSLGSEQILRELIWFCEAFDCEILLAPQITSTDGYWLTPKHQEGMPFFSTAKPRLTNRSLTLKRAFDIAFATCAVFFLAPVFTIVSLIILITEGHPIFYASKRVGVDGVPFNFLKFRTMIKNADTMVDKIQNMHSATHVLFKNPSDPRITRVGRILRRYSIDELPQFFNVLKGNMSVVGPRPPLISEALQYDSLSQRRLYVRPGITGPWQVSGRSDLDWEMSVRLDLDYAANWKFSSDIWTIFRTVLVVATGKGAY